MTVGRKDVAAFLGRRNFKGIYTKNILARTPAYAKFDRATKYVTSFPVKPWHHLGARLIDWQKVFDPSNIKPSRQPFPNNEYTKSNELIGSSLRKTILDAHAAGESTQKLSFRLGISMPRIDAVIRLEKVRKQMEEEDKITPEMKRLNRHMVALFDEIKVTDKGVPYQPTENLTEIPIPRETRTQRFQSIAESEPFGPVDAAKVLGIQPAAKTLEKLIQVTEEAENKVVHKSENLSFFAPRLEGETKLFRFTNAEVGNVGFRYGAARDDRKHARKVVYRPDGSKTYPLPVHS